MIVKLVSKIILFTVVILLSSFSVLYLNPDYEKEYIAGIISKLEKLKTVRGPKIVFIGGSNASFGIDTDLMERHLGIPVVNMALHGGLPLKFLIEQVKYHMNDGDILILSKEYSGLKDQYWNKMKGTELPKIITYDLSQIYVLLDDPTLMETTVAGIFNTIKDYIAKYPIEGRKGIKSVYDARAFKNDNLDSSYLIGNFKSKVEPQKLPALKRKSEVVKGLRAYKKYFDSKNVSFYITPPVIIDEYFTEDEILPFWGLFSEYSGVPLLNSEKGYNYSREYFFNSHYHTNNKGRTRRTLSLIDDIHNMLQLPVGPGSKRTIYVAEKGTLNTVGLDSFNGILNYKVVRRDAAGIVLKQSGEIERNYFRIRLDNKDFKGYHFSITLECDSVVRNNLRFRGVGKLESFDTIISLGNGRYQFWKKAAKVFYSNNNSYLGISLPNQNRLKDKEFTVTEVGLYRDIDSKDVFQMEYKLDNTQKKNLYFEIISSKDHLESTVFLTPDNGIDSISFLSNRLYNIDLQKERTKFIDFYTGEVLLVTANIVSLKSSEGYFIKVYE